ncbi:MAG: hypothetical protein HRF40_06820 [Nitrososphaera sp.]
MPQNTAPLLSPLFACPQCGNMMAKKHFDSQYWIADKNPVWTCSSCNIYYRLKELKKRLWHT